MIDGKDFKKEILNDVDIEIRELVELINQVEGVETTQCCFGHNEKPCQIYLRIKDLKTANEFIKKFFYFDALWRLVLIFDETGERDKELQFVLESKYFNYPTVNLMADNLTYRFRDDLSNNSKIDKMLENAIKKCVRENTVVNIV